jgi:hypothetical protein
MSLVLLSSDHSSPSGTSNAHSQSFSHLSSYRQLFISQNEPLRFIHLTNYQVTRFAVTYVKEKLDYGGTPLPLSSNVTYSELNMSRAMFSATSLNLKKYETRWFVRLLPFSITSFQTPSNIKVKKSTKMDLSYFSRVVFNYLTNNVNR